MHYKVVSNVIARDLLDKPFLLMRGDVIMNIKQLSDYVEVEYYRKKLKLTYHDFNNRVVYRSL